VNVRTSAVLNYLGVGHLELKNKVTFDGVFCDDGLAVREIEGNARQLDRLADIGCGSRLIRSGFDEVAFELGRTLDFFNMPEQEKGEVLVRSRRTRAR
jgi:hypothetical protein